MRVRGNALITLALALLCALFTATAFAQMHNAVNVPCIAPSAVGAQPTNAPSHSRLQLDEQLRTQSIAVMLASV
ncbi:hypothetical protein KFE25_002815 [Diacronema lutheri]|uniref:Uncharacterized protein n=1 Tax=Diacronema lutheri TaxID=2081491 RepID=A0A8J5XJ43_DIALT|nr:hypothetical protein KFE25_002815 [Diacronema lutheri]